MTFPRPSVVPLGALLLVAAGTLAGCNPSRAPQGSTDIALRERVDLPASGPACPVRRLLGIKDDPVLRGRALFENHCATCHGRVGDGAGPAAVHLNPRPRDFRSGQFKVRSTATMPTDADLYQVVSTGMPGSSMPAFGFLSEQQRRDLVAYVKHLSSTVEDGREVRWFEEAQPLVPLALPPPPPAAETAVATGRDAFLKHGCNACHGEEGRGDGPQAATMRDTKGFPLRPRDLHDDRFIGGERTEDIYKRIALGIAGTPMLGYPDAAMPPTERWALVEYIRSLRAPATAPPPVPASPALASITVPRATVPASPSDAAWDRLPASSVEVSPVWRLPGTSRRVSVRAVHDTQSISVLLEWDNPLPHRAPVRVQDFEDAAALQFALTNEVGSIAMGDSRHPVNLWRWRASRALQTSDAYPQLFTLGETGPRLRITAQEAGNPTGTVAAGAAEDLNASGFGTLSAQPAAQQDVRAEGQWRDGRWRVQLTRALAPASPLDVSLLPGHEVPVALAIWDGRTGDRNGRKSFSTWLTLRLVSDTQP